MVLQLHLNSILMLNYKNSNIIRQIVSGVTNVWGLVLLGLGLWNSKCVVALACELRDFDRDIRFMIII